MKLFPSLLCAFVTAGLLLSVAPSSHAATGSFNQNSLYKKIVKKSDDGDANDIHDIIREALAKNPSPNHADFVKKLIKRLKKNRDQLAYNVSEADLDRVAKRLRNWIKRNPFKVKTGPITPPASTIQNA